MGLSLVDKLRLLAKLSSTVKTVEEGVKMKNSTKIVGAIVGFSTLFLGLHPVQVALTAFLSAHPLVSTVIAAISTLLALVHNPVADTSATGYGSPSKIAGMVILCFGLFAHSVSAQTVPTAPPADGNNLYAVGANYSVNAKPAFAGSLLYARLLNANTGTFAFTNADFLPNTTRPFTVTNNIGAGVAQKVMTLGTVPIYCITGAGLSWSGTNTGYQYNGGCMASIKFKGILIMPAGRFLKSSVSNGTGYQPIIGFYIGKRW